jgi:hypothetical protein
MITSRTRTVYATTICRVIAGCYPKYKHGQCKFISVFIMMLAVFLIWVKQLSATDESGCLEKTGNATVSL